MRRLRVIVAVLVAASIVGISLTIVIFNQSQTNRQIAEQAQAASKTALLIASSQGFLDEEYYEAEFAERVVRLAPTWRALGLTSGRRSFFAEISRLETNAPKS